MAGAFFLPFFFSKFIPAYRHSCPLLIKQAAGFDPNWLLVSMQTQYRNRPKPAAGFDTNTVQVLTQTGC